MNFIYYDLIFLLLFSLLVGLFLYKNKKKLQKEGLLYLYRTSFGLDFIEKASKKIPIVFSILAVLSIICGYFLMMGGISLFLYTIVLIWKSALVIKIPPLMPLLPYVPSLFHLDYLPMFYFSYWIIAIAIVAICHEFMHGVFARFYNIRLKSTGFGFLGPFLAAFVEIDEKKMEKKPVKAQLAVLSGGSFANLILSILFFILLNLFFVSAFAQSGVSVPQLNVDGIIIPSYYLSVVNLSSVTYQDNSVNLTELSIENKTEYKLDGENYSYYLTNDLLKVTPKNSSVLIVYSDTPAYNLKINGTITEINGTKIKNYEEFLEVMAKLKPGQEISLQTSDKNYTLELGSDPANSSRAVLGVGFLNVKRSPLISIIQKFMMKKDSFTSYSPKNDASILVYNLLLWIMLINVSVMLVNMLPFSIFDGGRFFYLTILGITGSKKTAVKGFKVANTFILLILIALMLVWLLRMFAF
jgi:membrane-associated protease RseP (regulator of RpoE activity)